MAKGRRNATERFSRFDAFVAALPREIEARRDLLSRRARPFRLGRHLALLVGTVVAACAGLVCTLESLRSLDLLAIPGTVVLANLVEWFAHRYLLHDRLAYYPYAAHSEHHLFFDAGAMAIRSSREAVWVLMPLPALGGVAAMATGIALAVTWTWSWNAAALAAATALAYFLLYELLHLAFHMPHALGAPLCRRLARRHAEHHRAAAHGVRYFNVFLPLGDLVLGGGKADTFRVASRSAARASVRVEGLHGLRDRGATLACPSPEEDALPVLPPGRRIRVRGTVQGVGYRPFVFRLAHEHGVRGRVWNDARGVVIEAFAEGDALDRFTEALRASGPPAARVSAVEWSPTPAAPVERFEIVESAAGEAREVSIPPDLATCAACEREIADPGERRFAYPFTNCTHCGPRFTIALEVPYDRARTTMAAFPMCQACRREYEDPLDRRFHAQPVACPRCGPRLSLRDSAGAALAGDDPLGDAVTALRAGRIVAVKGLGGYHLACDATAPEAVRRLRERKRRDEKPFAVMAADLEAARALAHLSATEAALLEGVERPVVLLHRRADARLAPEIAPGNAWVGLILPYTPLHHLLMRRAAIPLVMTSANVSDEPMVWRDDDAVRTLAGIADLYLVHDREIAARCDDSVARVIAGRSVLLRRARGYVPRAVHLASPLRRPVLAVGGHLKNAFCFAAGDRAWLGPHIGDLDTAETVRELEEAVERLGRFLGVRPEVVAHDLHPDYASTHYAERRPEPRVAVQHHHAHVAAAVAEHGLTGPVLGVAYDGTGYGLDGTAWGGELLVVDGTRAERAATWRPLPLAGGERAIREVWRVALALLLDAFGGDAPLGDVPLFRTVPPEKIALVRQMIAQRVQAPLVRGVGRYFDAFAALGMGRALARFEGQAAIEWDGLADGDERGVYPFAVGAAPLREVDLRPAARVALGDLAAETPPSVVSARFHETVVAATASVARAVLRERGRLPVVLTGGCFHNARLAEGLVAALAPEHDVFLPGEVPPGDGGLAVGQAVLADALCG